MKTIAVLGANPALQKVLHFEQLHLDQVNRATQLNLTTGGKGTNFCRATRCHTTRTTAVLYTFLGGPNGDRVARLLAEEGIPHDAVRVPGETRECVTCLRAHAEAMTELIGPSLALPPAATAAMLARLEAGFRGNAGAAGLAIMGSLPDGTDPGFYTACARLALQEGRALLLDVVEGIAPVLRLPGADRALLKVNLEEFRRLTPGVDSLAAAFQQALRDWTVGAIAVTNGPGLAYLQVRGRALQAFAIPRLEGVVNPLGSGDTAAAVFFAEYLDGTDVAEAFRRGLVAASANCLQIDAGRFDRADFERLLDGVKVVEAKLD